MSIYHHQHTYSTVIIVITTGSTAALALSSSSAAALLSHQQEVQLSLTNHPTLVHTNVKIFDIQVLPSGEWLQFTGRIFLLLPTPLPLDALNEGGSPRSIGSISGVGELECLGYNLVKIT